MITTRRAILEELRANLADSDDDVLVALIDSKLAEVPQPVNEGTSPIALALLDSVCNRGVPPTGYERRDDGALVDWDQLMSSYLSSTETAVVALARGIDLIERHGGIPGRAAEATMLASRFLTAVAARS